MAAQRRGISGVENESDLACLGFFAIMWARSMSDGIGLEAAHTMKNSPDNSTFAPFVPTLPVGYVLGEFRIEEVLGQGGFGITYRATELATDYSVVIKENYPTSFAYRDSMSGELRPMHKCEGSYNWALESFEKEARTLRRLPMHTNLVRVTGVFRALNTAYIVMEPIAGANLAELYPMGHTMEPELLMSILRKLLSALEPLHGQGIIHRDIKPGNIMLTPAGEPVLIDFGAARPVQGTHTATQIGTMGYAPPEQMDFADDGQVAEKRAPQPHWDLYSLGCTCHQLITGRIPIAGARPLSEREDLQGKYPACLLSSIDKAHELLPANRWQSAQDWLDELTADERAAQEAELRRKEEAEVRLRREVEELRAKLNAEQEARKAAEKRAQILCVSQSAGAPAPQVAAPQRRKWIAVAKFNSIAGLICGVLSGVFGEMIYGDGDILRVLADIGIPLAICGVIFYVFAGPLIAALSRRGNFLMVLLLSIIVSVVGFAFLVLHISFSYDELFEKLGIGAMIGLITGTIYGIIYGIARKIGKAD